MSSIFRRDANGEIVRDASLIDKLRAMIERAFSEDGGSVLTEEHGGLSSCAYCGSLGPVATACKTCGAAIPEPPAVQPAPADPALPPLDNVQRLLVFFAIFAFVQLAISVATFISETPGSVSCAEWPSRRVSILWPGYKLGCNAVEAANRPMIVEGDPRKELWIAPVSNRARSKKSHEIDKSYIGFRVMTFGSGVSWGVGMNQIYGIMNDGNRTVVYYK